MIETATQDSTQEPSRPIPETYWLVPGRILVGEYPGSASRAAAMDRLRRFLDAGVTCFVDLTEPGEVPSYEPLLPMRSSTGRAIDYLREPLPDHGIPANRDVMQQTLVTIGSALADGHVVYVHCRAGIGRSAMVAGCWLAEDPARAVDALAELRRRWLQCAKSSVWPLVPETDAQAAYVRDWRRLAVAPLAPVAPARQASHRVDVDTQDRIRGALLGLAAGEAAGRSRQGYGDSWGQHTALALCVLTSLLDRRGFDARDQIERFLRWQRDGYLAPDGRAAAPSADIGKALAIYQWRKLPTAGTHDPRDRSSSSLSRAVAAAVYAFGDPVRAVELAGECSRTTHPSPVVIDACRAYAALLVGALGGASAHELGRGLYEPAPGLWTAHPLKGTVAAALRGGATQTPAAVSASGAAPAGAIQAVLRARGAVSSADFDDALRRALAGAAEPPIEAALTGALAGALGGARAIPANLVERVARRELIEDLVARLHNGPGPRAAPRKRGT